MENRIRKLSTSLVMTQQNSANVTQRTILIGYSLSIARAVSKRPPHYTATNTKNIQV